MALLDFLTKEKDKRIENLKTEVNVLHREIQKQEEIILNQKEEISVMKKTIEIKNEMIEAQRTIDSEKTTKINSLLEDMKKLVKVIKED